MIPQKIGRRECNLYFLDHDDGAVYFNVLNNRIPFLTGNERLKGSHSMACYHSIELSFLSAVYINLLHTKKPLDLYFKPMPNGFDGSNTLYVQPDILPKGSCKIESVEIDGKPWIYFDAENFSVKLHGHIDASIAPALMEEMKPLIAQKDKVKNWFSSPTNSNTSQAREFLTIQDSFAE